MPQVSDLVISTAQQYGVDPRLALELAIQESGLNQNARGTAGEIGVMQLTPATAGDLGVNPYDLADNIKGGVLYLRQQINRFSDWGKALAAYNCGPTCVATAISVAGAAWLSKIPASTRSYVSSILSKIQTQYMATVSVPVATPAELVQAVKEVPADTWKRIALYIGVGLLIYSGAALLLDEG